MLSEVTWTGLAAAHARQVDRWTAGHRSRRALGERHPVEDFVFTYYSVRPSRLRRWHPGAGRVLLGPAAAERLSWRWYGELRTTGSDGRAVRAVGLDLSGYL